MTIIAKLLIITLFHIRVLKCWPPVSENISLHGTEPMLKHQPFSSNINLTVLTKNVYSSYKLYLSVTPPKNKSINSNPVSLKPQPSSYQSLATYIYWGIHSEDFYTRRGSLLHEATVHFVLLSILWGMVSELKKCSVRTWCAYEKTRALKSLRAFTASHSNFKVMQRNFMNCTGITE